MHIYIYMRVCVCVCVCVCVRLCVCLCMFWGVDKFFVFIVFLYSFLIDMYIHITVKWV